ncbi:MAG: hypothetical protein WDZ42_01930 [Candidatus Saccharimonadales bacterium]
MMETEKRDLDRYRVGLKAKTASVLGAAALALAGCSFELRPSPEVREVLKNPAALSLVVCAEDLRLKIDELKERNSLETIIEDFEGGHKGLVEAGYDDPDCSPEDLPGSINVAGRRAITTATFLDR